MSIAQLFFKKGNFISTIELDIIITEGATATARLTENPVENGANVNDHIIIEPMTFIVEGVVSNASTSFIGQITKNQNVFNNNISKSKEIWDQLLELQVDRTPFTLVQNLRRYDNVVILSLTENQNKDTSNGLFFTATLKELIFVGSQIVTSDQFNDSNISDKMVPATAGGLKQLS